MELLRSLVFVPGNRANMLERALGFGADVVMVDLEDSVPPGEKATACEMAAEWVPRLAAAGRRVMVRVNSLDTGLTSQELDMVVCPELAGISVGKSDSAWDLQQVDRLLGPLESRIGIPRGTISWCPGIETAMAIVHVYEMARASQRIVGVAFGAEDYTNDMGVIRTDFGEECYYARSAVAVAARAARVAALDGPFVGFRDPDGLRTRCRHGAADWLHWQVCHPSGTDRHHQRDVLSPSRRCGIRPHRGCSLGGSRKRGPRLAVHRWSDGLTCQW